jgi:putative ABC transport system permease protein
LKILTKKIFREFRFNKFRSAVIILTVTVAIAMLVGFVNSKATFDESLAAHQEKLNNADVRIRFGEKYVPKENVTALKTNPEILAAGITNLEGRIFKATSALHEDEDYPAYLIGVEDENAINKLQLTKGISQISKNEKLFPQLSGNLAYVEQHFDDELLGAGADLEDQLNVTLDNSTLTVSIAGFVADSDYYYVVDEQTGMPTMGKLAIIYMPLATLQEHLNVTGVNEILIDTTERSHEASQAAGQTLGEIFGENIQEQIFWDNTQDRIMYDIDAGAIDKMGIVFGIFGLAAGAIAIYNSLSKLVLAQRTHIGLYGALGAQERDVLSHYIGYGIILGVIGTIFGWIVSFLMNYFFAGLADFMYGLTTTRVAFVPVFWIGGTLITLVVVLIFSVLSALPALRLTPREAMTAPYSTSQLGEEPILEGVLHPLGILRTFTGKIPLRTVFMNKKRSLSTVFAVAVSMIILVASASMMIDIMIGINQNYSDYEKYDVNVVLGESISEQEVLNWVQSHPILSDSIDIIEGYVYAPVFISRGFRLQAAPLQAFHENTALREFNVIKGKRNLNENEVLLGNNIANDLGAKPGDSITIFGMGYDNVSVKVAGITGELMDYSLLWTIEALKQQNSDFLGIDVTRNITGFIFDFADDLSKNEKKEIKQLIQQQFHPYVYADSEEAIKTFERLIEVLVEMLALIGLLGLVSLALFTFSSMSLAMMDREMEFLALRAMGSKRRTILKVIFLENLLYGIFGLIVGVPVTYLLLIPTYDHILPEWYVPVVVPFELWAVVVALIIFCVFLSTSLLAWKVWRSSLSDMLHNRMIT